MAQITSLVMEKVQFNRFPIISLWDISAAMATNQEANCQTFGVMEKVQFNRFPIISLWDISAAMATNQEANCQTFGYFELSYAKQHLYQIRVLLLQ